MPQNSQSRYRLVVIYKVSFSDSLTFGGLLGICDNIVQVMAKRGTVVVSRSFYLEDLCYSSIVKRSSIYLIASSGKRDRRLQ